MSNWTDARDSITGAIGGFLGGGLSSLLSSGGLPMPPGLPGMGGGGQQQMGGGFGGGFAGPMQASQGDQGELGYPQNLAGLMQLIGSNQQPQKMNLISGGGLI